MCVKDRLNNPMTTYKGVRIHGQILEYRVGIKPSFGRKITARCVVDIEAENLHRSPRHVTGFTTGEIQCGRCPLVVRCSVERQMG